VPHLNDSPSALRLPLTYFPIYLPSASRHRTLAGSLIGTVGGLIGGMKKERRHTTEIVRAIDKGVAAGAVDMEKLGPIMDRKQSPETKAIVDKIQGKAAA